MSESLIPMSIFTRLLRLMPLAGKLYAVTCKHETLTASVRRAICNFQYEYAVYQDQAAQAHKIFKTSLNEWQQQEEFQDKTSSELENLLHQDFHNFYDYINNNLALSCRKIAKNINEYFKSTRVCDSGNCKIGIYMFDENDLLVNVVYESDSKNPSDHTMFKCVVDSGNPYLDNNIPESFRSKSTYSDPSVNKERAFKYRNWMGFDKFPYARLLRKDEVRVCDKWSACRVDGGTDRILCKSHMAVPITFKGHVESGNLSPNADIKSLGPGFQEDIPRSIWGVVVVDYPETYFFDKTDPKRSKYGNTDINVLYQFADILSLVMLVNRNYYFTSDSVYEYKHAFPKQFEDVVCGNNLIKEGSA